LPLRYSKVRASERRRCGVRPGAPVLTWEWSAGRARSSGRPAASAKRLQRLPDHLERPRGGTHGVPIRVVERCAPGDPRHPTHLRRDRPPQSSRALSSTENSAIAAKVRRAFEERPRWQPALWRPRWRSAQPTSAGGSAFLASKKWRLLRSRILSRATSLRVQEITNNQPVEPRFVSRGITRAKRPRRAPVERREPVRRAVPNPFVVARCDPPCTDPRISSAVL